MATSETSESVEKSNVLSIKGIPTDWKAENLKRIFEPFGCILKVRVSIKDCNNQLRSRPIAFVTFDNIPSANNALEAMNGYRIDGCVLHISKAKQKIKSNLLTDKISHNCSPINPAIDSKSRINGFIDENCSDRLLVKGLPFSYSKESLIKLFEPFGRMPYVFLNSQTAHSLKPNFAYVQFYSCLDAFKALKDLNGMEIDGHKLEIKFTDPLHKESECNIRAKMRKTSEETKVDAYVSNATISELDEELLAKIFGLLSIKQKFGILRVCHLWRKVCTNLIVDERVLSFGRTHYNYNYGCRDRTHKVNDNSELSDAIIDANNKYCFQSLTRLAPIVRLTYNVECLQFANCFIDTIAFKWIITQCPKLRCLRFDNIEGIGELDWPKLGKPLSAKIVHFSYGGNKLNHWKSLSRMLRFLDTLEELTIFDCSQDLEKVFLNLSPGVTSISIRECPQLDLSAIKALTRRNGPKIKDLKVDFSDSNECELLIDCIYGRIPSLQTFYAFNINSSEIKYFKHDIEFNEFTIAYKEYIDLTIFAEPVRRNFEFLEVIGNIKPSNVQSITELIPECRELKLTNCQFHCECTTNAKQLLKNCYYSCLSCFDNSLESISLLPKIECLNINGTKVYTFDD